MYIQPKLKADTRRSGRILPPFYGPKPSHDLNWWTGLGSRGATINADFDLEPAPEDDRALVQILGWAFVVGLGAVSAFGATIWQLVEFMARTPAPLRMQHQEGVFAAHVHGQAPGSQRQVSKSAQERRT